MSKLWEEKDINQEMEIRSIVKLFILHLLPGATLSIIYIVLLKAGILSEFPKLVVLGLAGILSIVPMELGYLFYVSKKEVGSLNIFKMLGLKSNLKLKEYIIYAPLLLIITGLIMTALKPLSNYLLNTVFSFIPTWYNCNQDVSTYGKNSLILLILVSFFFFTLIGPIVEELYFRGYLLARMKWMGKYSVLLNAALFAVYHFWTPWLIAARFAAFLPLYYCVYKKDSLKLAILVHCLANFTDVIAFVMLL